MSDPIVKLLPATRLLFPRLRVEFVHDLRVGSHVISSGFVTDCATLPFFIQPMFNPYGKYRDAAFLHDWLLHCGIERRAAAKEFYRTMVRLEIPKIVRRAFYKAVRLNDQYVLLKNRVLRK